jgi:hypothetical protein
VIDFSGFVRHVHFLEQDGQAEDGPPIVCTAAIRLDDGDDIPYRGAWSVTGSSSDGAIVTVTADPDDLQVIRDSHGFPGVLWHGRSLLTPAGTAAIVEAALASPDRDRGVSVRFYIAGVHVFKVPTKLGAAT